MSRGPEERRPDPDREDFVRTVVFWLAVAGTLLAAKKLLLPCLLPFFWGWLAAALLRPAARRLADRSPLGRRTASFLCLGLFWLGALALVWWLGSAAFGQGAALLEQLPGWYRRQFLPAAHRLGQEALALLGRVAGPEAEVFLAGAGLPLEEILGRGISALSARLLAAAGGLAARLPGLGLACSFSVLSSFLILPDYEGISAFLLRQLPQKLAGPLRDSRDFLAGTLRRVIGAYLLIMAITFGEISLGLWLLRVDYYLVIGLGVAVLDILPVLGSGSVLVPWGLWCILGRRTALGAGLLLLYAVVTGVRAVLEPRIVGRRIGLSPLATLIAMYTGMKLWGGGGMILAPMAVTLLLFLDESGHIRLLRGR